MQYASEMKPGRELDALVAEHVMGWSVSSQWWNDDKSTFECQSNIDGTPVPHYSIDIAAAWEVLDKYGTKELGKIEHIKGWACTINLVTAHGETAPHAICLAALKGKAYENENAN